MQTLELTNQQHRRRLSGRLRSLLSSLSYSAGDCISWKPGILPMLTSPCERRRSPSACFRCSLFKLLLFGLFFLVVLLYTKQWALYVRHVGRASRERWESYTMAEAANFVGRNSGTIIVCTVNSPFLRFLNNWLSSVGRQGRAEEVLVVAEDYETLYRVNKRWPGHAVLIPPAVDEETAHNYGSQAFYNFTSRRPRHLLQILEMGYNVLYNDVDMVWMADPFLHFKGNHDIYVTDDSPMIKTSNWPAHICSCMIFLRPTNGAKVVLKKWIEEIQGRPWTEINKANDQPALNMAFLKTKDQADVYLLPQVAFPAGALYFENKKWANKTKGMQVIIHNNWIVGYENKLRRFKSFGLWFPEEHANESPLGKIEDISLYTP